MSLVEIAGIEFNKQENKRQSKEEVQKISSLTRSIFTSCRFAGYTINDYIVFGYEFVDVVF
jgi:hypothetical protein